MKKSFAVIAGILLLSGGVLAQSAASEKNNQEKNQTFTFIEKLPTTNAPRTDDLRFVDLLAENKAVKNAPYTATEVTESTQTLGDGNRIVNKTMASVARDSEGRTRREENAVTIGGLQANGPKMVTIFDPVAHTQFVFQSNDSSTGASSNSGEGAGVGSGSGAGFPHGFPQKVRVFNIAKNEGTGNVEFGTTNERGTKTYFRIEEKPEGEEVKHESLGVQVIEGVNAEGTRETRTIPAGAIGNERPIIITSETWTSPDLQRVVLSKRNDPRFGETVYKLTDITRGEPDPSLFQPPTNIKKAVPHSK
jgi:hypothetical protein